MSSGFTGPEAGYPVTEKKQGSGRKTGKGALQRGVENYLRSTQDYHTQGLRDLLAVAPLHPCCCVRCRAVVSVERFEHHWAMHEMQIDSMGAPGSTRWCPRPTTVVYSFGFTGLKANSRKRW